MALRREADAERCAGPGRDGAQDVGHSMLAARKAIEALVERSVDKAPIWAVNVDDEYHEEKR